jgi:hypothetical protein
LRNVLLPTLLLTLAAPAVADPTAGVGVTYSFGGGQPQVAIGVRVFSDDQQEEFAGMVGVDYMFGTQSWRGTIGAAYLAENVFVGVDLGYGLSDGTFGFGMSAGAVRTAEPAEPAGVETVDINDALDAETGKELGF